MALLSSSLSLPHHPWLYFPTKSIPLDFSLSATANSHDSSPLMQGSKIERIRGLFEHMKLSVSAYDTAWVAMVPSLSSSNGASPLFPECLTWVLENQYPNGSWGLCNNHPHLIKDSLTSTLACTLSLKKWNIGEDYINRGLNFIGSNIKFADDENQLSPIGFDVIFGGLLGNAIELGLNLPFSTHFIETMLLKHSSEIRRLSGSNIERDMAYLAYIAEGCSKLLEREKLLKYQQKNGSLFNSPSATAAAFTHFHDSKCQDYLHQLLEKIGNGVPATYPFDIYTRLYMVDCVERLGVARHFGDEISVILDDTYRCWLDNDEELFSDISTTAMSFRLLRMNGYDVSSDSLGHFKEENFFPNPEEGNHTIVNTVLEMHRASQITILPNEPVLEKLHSWSSHFLKQQLIKMDKQPAVVVQDIAREVEHTIMFPCYSMLERLENRRYIDQCGADNIRIAKTAFKLNKISNKDMLEFAIEDFQLCQSIHQKELELLDRWVKEWRLDQLKFARQKLNFCYFSVAATLFEPDFGAARISWAKNAILTTVIDDFFDIGGSKEELENFIDLVQGWDENAVVHYCSENVQIIFFALQDVINELGTEAFTHQGRDVKHHLIEIWLRFLHSLMKEAEWLRNKIVPSLDEYIKNGYVSFALGPIILPALYFVGPKLSEEVVTHPEYENLFHLTSICGRLLNDIQGFEREKNEGKLNSISLFMKHVHGASEEEAMKHMRGVIDRSRRELLRKVVCARGSVIPRCCKDLFWNMTRILHLFYSTNDGFTSPHEMLHSVNAVIHEPLVPLVISCDEAHGPPTPVCP
ncbi:hypothetical protein AMTRI_Chr02g256220 [Amborella trichopoda]